MFSLNRLRRIPEAIAFYLEDSDSRGESPRTIEGKSCNLNKFAQWAASQGVYRLKQVDLSVLEAYRRYLNRYRQPYSNKPLDKSTVRNRLTSITVFFDRLHYHGIVTSNPVARFQLPPPKRRLPKDFLTDGEANRLFISSLHHGTWRIRNRAILEVFYATGVRRMELANLTIRDLDAKQGVIRITKGKGEKDRRVPIAKRACDWVKIYLDEERTTLGNLSSGSTLFLSSQGLKMAPHQLTYLASTALKRSGVKKKGACNIFRHSAATLMMQNGADTRLIQEMLGHADISTTQVYTHVTMNQLMDVYAKTHPAALS